MAYDAEVLMFVDPFDSHPEEYDAWYDENHQVFKEELGLVRDWMRGSPSLEIGVGTGRFASALGIMFGLDRARRALCLAKNRGVRVVAGDAEALPFKRESFALVCIFFSLEFLSEPEESLAECLEVIIPGGRLVILHFVPSASVSEKRGQGFYSGMVQLYDPQRISRMARGFHLVDQREQGDISALLFVKA